MPKIWGHSNFGGDKTRFAQTVSPLTEIPAPFLTPDTMPEETDPLTLALQTNSANGLMTDKTDKTDKPDGTNGTNKTNRTDGA
ncbi:MAG TPA: hypothetical protein DIW30_01060 [Bacteroidales bacterium]|nr:hypothetical protein [Bacteroidales bacterium]